VNKQKELCFLILGCAIVVYAIDDEHLMFVQEHIHYEMPETPTWAALGFEAGISANVANSTLNQSSVVIFDPSGSDDSSVE